MEKLMMRWGVGEDEMKGEVSLITTASLQKFMYKPDLKFVFGWLPPAEKAFERWFEIAKMDQF